MWQTIGRMILRKILTAPETKQRVMVQLRDLAAKSESKIDDTAVDVVSEVWDVVVGTVTSKI